MRSAASVTVVGLNELPLFTVISDSNVRAAAGNHLGFGLQPMPYVVSLGTALIHINKACLHGDPSRDGLTSIPVWFASGVGQWR